VNAEEACIRNNVSGHIRVQLLPDGLRERVRVEIEDSGPGIPPEIQRQVFEPFSTTKAPGAGIGLGLTIVRALVQRHKGDISFETTIGKGTTFIVELPMSVSIETVSVNHQVAPPNELS